MRRKHRPPTLSHYGGYAFALAVPRDISVAALAPVEGQHLPGIPASGGGQRAWHRWAQATAGRVAADFARKWVGIGGDPAYLDRSESNDRWPRRVGAGWLRRMRGTAGGRALPLTHADGLDKEEGAASCALRGPIGGDATNGRAAKSGPDKAGVRPLSWTIHPRRQASRWTRWASEWLSVLKKSPTRSLGGVRGTDGRPDEHETCPNLVGGDGSAVPTEVALDFFNRLGCYLGNETPSIRTHVLGLADDATARALTA